MGYEPEIGNSIIEIPPQVRASMQPLEQRAVVVEVGPHAWHDEPTPRAKPGDLVLVAKFSGYLAKGILDDQPYRIVNDRDIFAAITAEKQLEVANG